MYKEFTKYDAGKLDFALLPVDALEEIIKVLMYGAEKYSRDNWSNVGSWKTYFNALMRHSWAWWKGEDNDAETGLSHLAHAGCCVLFMLALVLRGKGKDDRA